MASTSRELINGSIVITRDDETGNLIEITILDDSQGDADGNQRVFQIYPTFGPLIETA